MKHKGISLLCAACLAFTGAAAAMPATTAVYAEETSGKCGDNLTWKYDAATAALTIEGTGDMYDWDTSSDDLCPPWTKISSPIHSVIIKDGVTSIGDKAFPQFSGNNIRLTEVFISDTVKTIGKEAFYNSCGLSSVIIPKSVTLIKEGAFYYGGETSGIYFIYILNPEIVIDDPKGEAFINRIISGSDGEGHHYTIRVSAVILCEEGSTLKSYKEKAELNNTATYTTSINIRYFDPTISYLHYNWNGSEATNKERDALVHDTYNKASIGTEFALPGCELAPPEGKKFAGWEINGKTYQAGDHITPTEQITVLKAMWKDEIAPTYLAGELDGKNGITADDAQITLMAAVNILANKPSGLTEAQELAADVDGNSKITAEDAQYILIYAIQDLANKNPKWSDIIK